MRFGNFSWGPAGPQKPPQPSNDGVERVKAEKVRQEGDKGGFFSRLFGRAGLLILLIRVQQRVMKSSQNL